MTNKVHLKGLFAFFLSIQRCVGVDIESTRHGATIRRDGNTFSSAGAWIFSNYQDASTPY